MNTSFFNSINLRSKIEKFSVKPEIIGLILIAFMCFFAACNDKTNTNATQKTDPPPVQQNNQSGGEHGGMGDYRQGMDTIHRGMGHDMRGMDTIHGGMGHNMRNMHKPKGE